MLSRGLLLCLFAVTATSSVIYRDEYGNLVKYEGRNDELNVFQKRNEMRKDYPLRRDEGYPKFETFFDRNYAQERDLPPLGDHKSTKDSKPSKVIIEAKPAAEKKEAAKPAEEKKDVVPEKTFSKDELKKLEDDYKKAKEALDFAKDHAVTKKDTPKAAAQRGDTQKGDTQKGDTQKGDTAQRGDTQKGDTQRDVAPKVKKVAEKKDVPAAKAAVKYDNLFEDELLPAKKEAPKPTARKDVPKPTARKDVPKPTASKDVPIPTKKDSLRPEKKDELDSLFRDVRPNKPAAPKSKDAIPTRRDSLMRRHPSFYDASPRRYAEERERSFDAYRNRMINRNDYRASSYQPRRQEDTNAYRRYMMNRQDAAPRARDMMSYHRMMPQDAYANYRIRNRAAY